jgi:hypothetical protein
MAVTVVAIVALLIGYLSMNAFHTGRRRKVEIALSAANNKRLLNHEISPVKVKARIMQTLTQNTMDIHMLNNSQQAILVKIDSDMQKDGPLHGLLLERSTGQISHDEYEARLAQYVKTLASDLNVPLMNRTGRAPGGTMYGRVRSRYGRGAGLYGFTARARRALPSYRVGVDQQIEMLDDTLRRY